MTGPDPEHAGSREAWHATLVAPRSGAFRRRVRGRGLLARYLGSSPAERAQMLEEDPREIVPATDDRPFFFHFYPWRNLFTFHATDPIPALCFPGYSPW